MLDQSYYDAIERLPEVRYVVSFSTGASSAVVAKRAIERYGRGRVEIVFADTRIEDEDNYRFMRDFAARFDVAITTLTDGRTPLEVAKQQSIIPNQKIAPCTRELKIVPFVGYLKQLQREGYQPTALLGMGYGEQKRMVAPRKNYAAINVAVDYPLLWQPVCYDPVAEVKAWGIEPPRMYRLGYKHANCAGACVKQGAGDWRRTLEHFPSRFAEYEAWERDMRQDARFAEYAFLRDETGGTVKAKTLEQLRLESEAKDERQLKLFAMMDELDFGCTLECGAGDPGSEAA
jgi:hypothetical protein